MTKYGETGGSVIGARAKGEEAEAATPRSAFKVSSTRGCCTALEQTAG